MNLKGIYFYNLKKISKYWRKAISKKNYYESFIAEVSKQFPIFEDLQFPMNFISEGETRLNKDEQSEIKQFIKILNKIRQSDVYRTHVYAHNTRDVVSFDPGNAGVFMTYDFFNTPDGLRLIEINTNGGGFIVSMLMHYLNLTTEEQKVSSILNEIKTMFENEYFLATGRKTLKNVVIVDENPETQRLYFEVLGFQKLFQSFGWTAEICDPKDLLYDVKNKGLKTPSGMWVDLVYNRHCDFFLEDQSLNQLKLAYLSGAIALSPNPHEYALLADKQRLIDLSNSAFLYTLNLEATEKELIQKLIPNAQKISEIPIAELHHNKAAYFFKPINSFGSKGVYMGKKISHQKIDKIYTQAYIVQRLFIPKKISIPGIEGPFKEEIRVFAYMQHTQLFASRLYKGQACNMKEVGGGFARVKYKN